LASAAAGNDCVRCRTFTVVIGVTLPPPIISTAMRVAHVGAAGAG
jgi:hypothetical protein